MFHYYKGEGKVRRVPLPSHDKLNKVMNHRHGVLVDLDDLSFSWAVLGPIVSAQPLLHLFTNYADLRRVP